MNQEHEKEKGILIRNLTRNSEYEPGTVKT